MLLVVILTCMIIFIGPFAKSTQAVVSRSLLAERSIGTDEQEVLDYIESKLEFINKIEGVSIKALNGKYLSWVDSQYQFLDAVVASADLHDAANSQWTIFFERIRDTDDQIVRIMNEERCAQGKDAFIRFNPDTIPWISGGHSYSVVLCLHCPN